MSVKISFADLTHTGQIIATNTFPLGISYVAAYATQELGDEIDIEIFKYPDDFTQYLEATTPQFAGFTAYSWNVMLGYEYARRIKAFSPGTVTVFGGPNFPATKSEQHEFLTKHSAIDCFFEFEGEIPFVKFFKAMKAVGFDWEKFKAARTVVPNIRYLVDGELISGELAPKVADLDTLPSPYLSGLSDKFFDDILIPMLQTTRGCPYSCAFCWEGGDYFQKTKQFGMARVKGELHYMADRVQRVPELEITDANFGIFETDVEITQEIVSIRAEHPHGWPRSITSNPAKNNKQRTVQLVKMLGGAMSAKAALQTTDPTVLKIIKRKNVPLEAVMELAQSVEVPGIQSECELILCLEGDSKKAHFKSVCDMLDAPMTYLRTYQLILLPGTVSCSTANRAKFEMETRFRVLPRCFGYYTLRGETFPVAEIEEIVISHNTMSYEDYQACRDLGLTVEIFNNDSIFLDLALLLTRNGVSRSEFILAALDNIVNGDNLLSKMYADFRDEEKNNLAGTLDGLETFVQIPGVLQQYLDGEYGQNELYKYRALALTQELEAVHKVAYATARALLKQEGHYDDQIDEYLNELNEFSLMRKSSVMDTEQTARGTFHFDFPLLMESNFTLDPFELYRPEGVEVEVYHSEEQRDMIQGFLGQYGTSLVGLGKILLRADMNRMYRVARSLGTVKT